MQLSGDEAVFSPTRGWPDEGAITDDFEKETTETATLIAGDVVEITSNEKVQLCDSGSGGGLLMKKFAVVLDGESEFNPVGKIVALLSNFSAKMPVSKFVDAANTNPGSPLRASGSVDGPDELGKLAVNTDATNFLTVAYAIRKDPAGQWIEINWIQ